MQAKTLKQYAKEARKRMKSGFWTKINEEREKFVAEAVANGQSAEVAREQFKRKIMQRIYNSEETAQVNDDEEFYKKVCEVLETSEFLMSPLSRLIDHSIYDNLNERDRQNYILKLSDRFVIMKERYAEEHPYSLNMVN